MEASSRESLVRVRERLDELTREPSGLIERTKDRLTREPRATTADELTAWPTSCSPSRGCSTVSSRCAGRCRTRRASRTSGPRSPTGCSRRGCPPAALDLVETVARQRWSRPPDLVEAFMALATEASLDAAEARGELDSVEDELFRFGRIVGGDRELARILSDRKAPAEGKAALLDRLLSGKVSPVTEQLLRNVLTGPHAGHAENAIERLSEVASRRRGQSVARVTTAVRPHRRAGAAADRGARPDLRPDHRPAGDRRPERARRSGRPGGRRGHRRQHRPPTGSRRPTARRLTSSPTRPPTTPQTRPRREEDTDPWPS